jgi:hypothetical protein
MVISPTVVSRISREQKRARIKALRDAAELPGRNPRQAEDMRVRARLLEAEDRRERAELERIDELTRLNGTK